MNLLIDTHVLLWFLKNDSALPTNTKNIIESTQNRCFVSMATYWEIAIKYSLKRLELKSDLINFFELIERSGFEILPITVEQILELSTLNFHHHDPFDRILIAQAKAERLDIITKDAMFSKYNIHCIWG
jgi:PIN domain nuclease of toxin-antitoxin system